MEPAVSRDSRNLPRPSKPCTAGALGRVRSEDPPRLTGASLWILALVVGLAGLAAPGNATPPLIDHQEVSCSLPGKHPRICATIADDGIVKRAKIYFRAAGQSTFYWTEMSLDFRSFCATLPIPDSSVTEVQYYLWAIDDGLETERTKDLVMTVDANRSCEHPVIDEDPERTSNLVVHATARKQGKKIKGFLADGVEYQRIKR